MLKHRQLRCTPICTQMVQHFRFTACMKTYCTLEYLKLASELKRPVSIESRSKHIIRRFQSLLDSHQHIYIWNKVHSRFDLRNTLTHPWTPEHTHEPRNTYMHSCTEEHTYVLMHRGTHSPVLIGAMLFKSSGYIPATIDILCTQVQWCILIRTNPVPSRYAMQCTTTRLGARIDNSAHAVHTKPPQCTYR